MKEKLLFIILLVQLMLCGTQAWADTFFGWYVEDADGRKRYISYEENGGVAPAYPGDEAVFGDADYSSGYGLTMTVTADYIAEDGRAIFHTKDMLLPDGSTLYRDYDLTQVSGILSEVNGGTLILEADGALYGEHYLSPGTRVLIPYNDEETWIDPHNPEYQFRPGGSTDLNCYQYRTLTTMAGSILTVGEGAELEVAGQQLAAGAPLTTGGPFNACGCINMKNGGEIIVENEAALYCLGAIIGQNMLEGNNTREVGSITVKNGGVVCEYFVIGDWRGGTRTSQLIGQMWRRIFPFCSYYIQGIEVPMTLEYGAREFVRSLLSDSSGSIIVPSEFGIIGTGNAMFLMTDAGSSVKKWYDATTDHTCIELIGTAKLSHLELSMMDIDVSSENFVLPIPCGMRILLKNCNMNLSNEINILPGAILEIEEDANVTVTNNIFVWDMDQWEKFAYNRYFYTMDYTLTPHYKRDGNNKSTMGDGRIVVDGTLTLDGSLNSKGQRKGNLYTSLSGADVMGNGGGRIIINGTAEMPDTAAHQVTSTQNDWHRIPMYPVKLHNDNDSYTATAVNNTYKNLTTRWFHNDVTENADHTWNFTYLNPTVDATSKSVYTINTIGRGWWSNVEEDTKVNTFHMEGATDPYYNYTVNGAWLQLDRTETDGLYSGSDNKLYSYLDNVWTTSYEIDANCLYDFGGTKKARVGENFVEIAKNSNDEAYHNVANASQYYLQFEGCDWREATKVAGKEKAYSVSGQIYIWASIDGKPLEWLAVTVSGNYYTAKNEQNVNIYYEWDAEAGQWDTPKPLFRVTDATGSKEFAVLAEALMYVNSLRNPTFTLLADVANQSMSFTSALMSNTITLDLNGHTIGSSDCTTKQLIKLDAEFTNLIITDNAGGGLIVNNTTQAIYVNAGTVTIAVPVQGTYQVVYVEGVGVANIVEGATITAKTKTNSSGTTYAAIRVIGRLNVMGGTITASSFAIDATSALSASHNSTSGLEAVTKDFQHAVTISGGTITSNGTTREAIYMQGGLLVMTGGTLTSKATGIRGEYKHAQLSADYGSKILATRYSTIDIRGGHITAIGKGICCTDTMRVSAGNINVSGTDSVFGVAPVKIPAWPRRMEITGGTITATGTGHTICGVFLSSNSQGSKITGGTITASGNEGVYGVYLLSPNEYEVSDATITATATSEAAYGVYAYYPYASLKGNLNVSAAAPGDAYAVFVETMPGDKDELDYPSVSIYDGTYTSAITDGSTAYAVYAQEHFQDLKLVVIYGGKFRCTKNGEIADELFYEGTHPAIFAQGGYFATPYCECPANKIVNNELPKYVAAGYPIGAEEVTSGPEFEAGYRTHLTTMFTARVYDKDGNLLSEHHLRAGEAPVQEAPFVLNYRFKGWRDNKGRLWSELPPCDVASTPAVVTYTAEYEQAICELETDGETEYYMSVSAAWTEAIKHKTATVRLLQSVTLDNPRLSCNNTGIADQYITFDMNGCTFTSTSGRVFSNIRGTSLTLEFTDSKGGGRIYEKGTNSYILYNECDTKNKATIIVNGGTLQGDYRIFYFCDKEHFIINDGELKVSTSSTNNFIFFPINHAQGARVTINGGELTFREKCFYYWYETITQCSGGYYTASTLFSKNSTNYTIFNQHLAPGCAVHTLNSAEPEYARGMRYQVFKTADAEAQIGSKLYPTFHQAYLAATSGQTITLLKDVSGWDGQHDFNKSVTIDLNGHTLNGSNAHAWMNLGSSVTVTVTSSVEGGRLVAELPAGSESNQYPRVLNVTNSDGVLNLNNISIEFTTPESSYQAMGMVISGTSTLNMTNCDYIISGGAVTELNGIVEQGSATAVVDGCTIRGASPSSTNLLYPQMTSTLTVRNSDLLVQAENGKSARCVLNNATATIESGTFRAESSKWTVTIYNSSGTCTILDGYYSVSAGGNCFYDNARNLPSIYGGYYTQSMTNYLPESCVQRALTNDDPEYADGYRYQVKVTAVAKVTVNGVETKYASFMDAVNAANATTNPTLTLLKNVQLTATPLLKRAMTFDLNGYTISGSSMTFEPWGAGQGTSKALLGVSFWSGGEVIITDSSDGQNGKIEMTDNTVTNHVCALYIGGGTVRMTGGTISAINGSTTRNTNYYTYGVNAGSGSFILDGGQVKSWTKDNYTASLVGNVTVNGGKVYAESELFASRCINLILKTTTATVTGGELEAVAPKSSAMGIYVWNGNAVVSGGKFLITCSWGYGVNADQSQVDAKLASATVTGGYYSRKDNIDKYCTSEYAVMRTKDVALKATYPYEVTYPDVKVTKDDVVIYKGDWSDAISAANNTTDAIVTLLNDIETTNQNISKSMVIDLNGHTLSGTGRLLTVGSGAHLQLMDSNVGGAIRSALTADWSAVVIVSVGQLTVSDITIEATQDSPSQQSYAVQIYTGQSMVLNSGTLISYGLQPTLLNNGGTLTINGGTLLNMNIAAAISNYRDKDTQFLTTINGGYFRSVNGGGDISISHGTLVVKGGYYAHSVSAGFIAPGYRVRNLVATEPEYAQGYRYKIIPKNEFLVEFTDNTGTNPTNLFGSDTYALSGASTGGTLKLQDCGLKGGDVVTYGMYDFGSSVKPTCEEGKTLSYSVVLEVADLSGNVISPRVQIDNAQVATMEKSNVTITANSYPALKLWLWVNSPNPGTISFSDFHLRAYAYKQNTASTVAWPNWRVVSQGDVVTTIPAAKEHPGYTFLGWFDAPEGGNEFDPSAPITQDTKVYAHWKVDQQAVVEKDGSEIYRGIWSEAISIANNNAGATITLLKDVSNLGYQWISTDLTLDLNGHVLSGSNTMFEIGGGHFTIMDSQIGGRIESEIESQYIRAVNAHSGKLTLQSGTVKVVDSNSNCSGNFYAIGCNPAGEFVMNGGTVLSSARQPAVLNNGGTVTINDGVVTNNGTGGALSNYTDPVSEFLTTINGGYFYSLGGADVGSSSGTLVVKGGYYVHNISDECMAAGYTTSEIKNGEPHYADGYRYKVVSKTQYLVEFTDNTGTNPTNMFDGSNIDVAVGSSLHAQTNAENRIALSGSAESGGTIKLTNCGLKTGDIVTYGVYDFATSVKPTSSGAFWYSTVMDLTNSGGGTPSERKNLDAALISAEQSNVSVPSDPYSYIRLWVWIDPRGNGPITYSDYQFRAYIYKQNAASTIAWPNWRIVSKDEVVTIPAVKERPGYNFLGWFDAPDGGNEFDPSAPITHDMKVYAHWQKIEFGDEMDIVDWGTNSVTLNMNGYGANHGKWGVKNASDEMLLAGNRAPDRTLVVSTEALTPNSDLRINVYGDTETGSPVLESSRTYRVPYIYTSSTTLSEAISDDEAILYVKSGTLSINANVMVAKVVVCPGAGLVVASGKTLTTGDLVLRGRVWEYEQPKLTIDGSLTVNGQSYYTRIIADKTAYYPFALPFASSVSAVRLSTGQELSFGESANWNLKYYDGAERAIGKDGWQNHDGGAIEANTYYIMGSGSAYYREFYFPITLGEATTSMSVSKFASTNAANAGWNGLCSPFTGMYHQSFGDPSEAVKITTKNEDNRTWWQRVAQDIYPFYPFFFQTEDAGTLTFGSELTFEASAPASVAARTQADANTQVTTQWIQLLLSNERGEKDETNLYVHPSKFTSGYDGRYDLSKMLGEGSNRPQTYTEMACGKLAFNALPDSIAATRIPVGVIPGSATELTFSLGIDEYLDRVEAVNLIDDVLGTTTNLLDSDYNWTAEDGTTNRFYLSILFRRTPGIATDVENVIGSADDVKKIFHDGKLYIVVGNTIYDATGKKVQ